MPPAGYRTVNLPREMVAEIKVAMPILFFYSVDDFVKDACRRQIERAYDHLKSKENRGI